MPRLIRITTYMLFVAGLTVQVAVAHAQTAKTFLGEALSGSDGTYLVLKDVNVRSKPLTKSKRVGRFRKGARIQSPGKAKGTQWIAVRQDGKELGFIYGTALAPVLDGKLKKDLTGSLASAGKPACKYVIAFAQRNEIEGEQQIISDYDVTLNCTYKNQPVELFASMFFTELPYLDLKKDLFQINVDVLGVSEAEDDSLSIISIYQPSKAEIRYEGASDPGLAATEKPAPIKANDVPGALRGALAFAYKTWKDSVWQDLSEQ
jgi:hypothetical protein